MTVYSGGILKAPVEYSGPITINCLVSHGWNDRINSFKLFSKSDSKKVDETNDKWEEYFKVSN